jgi:hypothetical protein
MTTAPIKERRQKATCLHRAANPRTAIIIVEIAFTRRFGATEKMAHGLRCIERLNQRNER